MQGSQIDTNEADPASLPVPPAPPAPPEPPVPPVSAWILRNAERYRIYLAVFIIVLYLAGLSGSWHLSPDAIGFASIAKNMVSGQGYSHPNQTTTVAQPGLPYLISVNFLIFGRGVVWPILVMIHLIAVAVLFLTYRLFCIQTDRATAVIVAFSLGVCFNFNRHSTILLADMPFMLGLMVFLIGVARLEKSEDHVWPDYVLAAIGLVIMALFRYVVLVVAAALVLSIGWKLIRQPQRKPYLVLIGVSIATIIAIRLLDPRGLGQLTNDERVTAVMIFEQFGQTLRGAVTRNLPNLLSDVTIQAMIGNKLGHMAVNIGMSIVMLAAGVWLIRKHFLWGGMVILFVLQWVLFLPDVRYFLPILPFLIFAWWQLAILVERKCHPHIGPGAMILMMVLLIGMNLGRTIGHIVNPRAEPFIGVVPTHRFRGVLQMSEHIRNHVPPEAVIISSVNTNKALTYFSDRLVSSGQHHQAIRKTTAPIYVVRPLDANVRNWLVKRKYEFEPAIARVVDKDEKWTMELCLLKSNRASTILPRVPNQTPPQSPY